MHKTSGKYITQKNKKVESHKTSEGVVGGNENKSLQIDMVWDTGFQSEFS